MGADISIFKGNQEPNRTLTLDLRITLGTGDFFMNGVDTYYIGPDISNNTPGWISYNFPWMRDPSSFPPGGQSTRGTVCPGHSWTGKISCTMWKRWGSSLDSPDLLTPITRSGI
jgi:hypothetical protein